MKHFTYLLFCLIPVGHTEPGTLQRGQLSAPRKAFSSVVSLTAGNVILFEYSKIEIHDYEN